MFATRQLRADKRAARGERFGAAMTAAVYMYAAMRWIVFRDAPAAAPEGERQK